METPTQGQHDENLPLFRTSLIKRPPLSQDQSDDSLPLFQYQSDDSPTLFQDQSDDSPPLFQDLADENLPLFQEQSITIHSYFKTILSEPFPFMV